MISFNRTIKFSNAVDQIMITKRNHIIVLIIFVFVAAKELTVKSLHLLRSLKTPGLACLPSGFEYEEKIRISIVYLADNSECVHTVRCCSLEKEIIQHIEYPALMARVKKTAQ